MKSKRVFYDNRLIIKPRSIVVLPEYVWTEGKRQVTHNNKFDLSQVDNKVKGTVSRLSAARLRYAIQMLWEISPWHYDINPKTGQTYKWKLNFITLTLPCSQRSFSDYDCKRFLLAPMIQDLKRKYNVSAYVWKAETQVNGNIHFHLTTNTYIPHDDLRKRWNHILNRWGFIEQYRQEQKEWHKNGFKPRPKLFKTWNLLAQRKAYKRGIAENWSNPNSTDIHSTRHVKDMTAYLVKYFLKNEPNKKGVEGRLVGYSDNLSYKNKLSLYSNQIDAHSHSYLEQLPSGRKIQTDFATIILFDEKDWNSIATTDLAIEWRLHLKRLLHYSSPREQRIRQSVSPRKKPPRKSCRIYVKTKIKEKKTPAGGGTDFEFGRQLTG